MKTGSANYLYNGDEQMTSVTTGTTTTYSYDGDGRRVEKSGGTIYWYGMNDAALDETNLSGTLTNEYVFFGGKRVARRDSSSNVFYYVADHLGTSREIVQAGQTSACYDADFFPYGAEIAPYANSCPQNYKFTGKERDSESGLDNFGARYLTSSFGRFMSPDPLGGKLIDAQTLNKYSYAVNNPLRYTDPTGLYTCADDANKCKTQEDQAFYNALQNDLKSEDPNVRRAAKAFGEQGVDNGVVVKFADLSTKGENGNTVSTIEALGKNQDVFRAHSEVTINALAKGADFDAAVAHEGSHVADAQDVVRSGLTVIGDNWDAGGNITPYVSEQRAWGVTNSILGSDNESRKFYCGFGTCELGTGLKMQAQLPGIVDQILANNSIYNQNGKPMTSANQGISVVNGIAGQTPKAQVPH